MIKVGTKGVEAVIAGADIYPTVMLGGREVHPTSQYGTMTNTFDNYWSYADAPISVFDDRTVSGSERNTAHIGSGYFAALANSQPTYQSMLSNRVFSGNHSIIEGTIGSTLQTRSRPISLVLHCSVNGYLISEISIGSDGLNYQSYEGSFQTYGEPHAMAIAPGDKIRAERIGKYVVVSVNGVTKFSVNHASVKPLYTEYFSGFGTYSDSQSSAATSSKFSKVTIDAATDRPSVIYAQGHFIRKTIAEKTTTEICRVYTHNGGNSRITLNSVAWGASTDFSTRKWTVLVNGSSVGEISDQNGSSLNLANVNIPAGSTIIVNAYSSSAPSQNRTVASGSMLIEPM